MIVVTLVLFACCLGSNESAWGPSFVQMQSYIESFAGRVKLKLQNVSFLITRTMISPYCIQNATIHDIQRSIQRINAWNLYLFLGFLCYYVFTLNSWYIILCGPLSPSLSVNSWITELIVRNNLSTNQTIKQPF